MKVPDVYFINLETANERKEKYLKYYPEGIRFDAVNGKTMTDIERHQWNASHNVTGGILGCFASHVKLWKKISEGDSEFAVISEDDYEAPDDFMKKIEKIYSELPSDWDIVYLYYYDFPRFVDYYMRLQGFPIDKEPYSKNLIKRDFNLSTCCYMISKKGAQKLYDYYPELKGVIDV